MIVCELSCCDQEAKRWANRGSKFWSLRKSFDSFTPPSHKFFRLTMNAHRSEKEATKLGSLAMADEGISYREYDVSTTKTIENMIVGNGNEEFEPECWAVLYNQDGHISMIASRKSPPIPEGTTVRLHIEVSKPHSFRLASP